jgi:hypothetical protein
VTDGDPWASAVARSPRSILDEMTARAKRAAIHDRPRPEVALYLASGPVIAGTLITTSDDRGMAVVLLQIGTDRSAQRVVSVRIDAVVAVAYDLLPPVIDAGPAPGRLEVARAIAGHAPALAAALGVAIDLTAIDDPDDRHRRAVVAAAPALGAVLTRLAHDDLGREALLMLTSIQCGAGATGDVRKDGVALLITVPSDPDRAWGERELQAAIEAAL